MHWNPSVFARRTLFYRGPIEVLFFCKCNENEGVLLFHVRERNIYAKFYQDRPRGFEGVARRTSANYYNLNIEASKRWIKLSTRVWCMKISGIWSILFIFFPNSISICSVSFLVKMKWLSHLSNTYTGVTPQQMV